MVSDHFAECLAVIQKSYLVQFVHILDIVFVIP